MFITLFYCCTISTQWQNSTKRFAFFAFKAIDSSFRINENARSSFIAYCFYQNFGYVQCSTFGLIWKRKRANSVAGLSPHRFILIYFHLYIRKSNCILPNSARRRKPTQKNSTLCNRCVNCELCEEQKRDNFFLSVAALIFGYYLCLLLPVVDLFGFFFGSSLVRSTLLSPWKFIGYAIWIWPELLLL